ncbi:MAG: hypothetical protein U0359_14780 [Byssovorax sp.]
MGSIVVALALGAPSLGCKGPDLTLAATQAVRWAERAEDDASLAALFYAGATHADTPEAMVDGATAAITAALSPGCVPAPKVEGARATFTFDQCQGPGDSHGVARIQGAVTAAYRINDATGDMLGVDLDTRGLSLNGASRDRSLTARNQFPAASWSEAPERERAFQLAEQHPVTSASEDEDALVSFAGSYEPPADCDAGAKSPPRIDAATGLVRVDDGTAWTISTAGLVRCGDRCPRAGTITLQLQIAVRVELDGSDTARATDLGSGETLGLPLSCTP